MILGICAFGCKREAAPQTRLAEADGVAVGRLFASAGQAPVTIADSAPLPTTQAGLIADMVDLGGTDPRLLDDDDFVELLVQALQAGGLSLKQCLACLAGELEQATLEARVRELDEELARCNCRLRGPSGGVA